MRQRKGKERGRKCVFETDKREGGDIGCVETKGWYVERRVKISVTERLEGVTKRVY